MRISHVTLEQAGHATGVVVVIDVLRAFTTAAYALDAGAARIVATGSVEDAFAARDAFPGALLMGEVDGLAIDGFDMDNSPQGLAAVDLAGRTLIQRTTAGTQGVVRASGASALFAASLVCAEATTRAVAALAPDEVTFVITGRDDRDGEEDQAAADWFAARLAGEQPDADVAATRVARSDAGRRFVDPGDRDFDVTDLHMATAVDAVDLAMRAQYDEQGRPVLHAVRAAEEATPR